MKLLVRLWSWLVANPLVGVIGALVAALGVETLRRRHLEEAGRKAERKAAHAELELALRAAGEKKASAKAAAIVAEAEAKQAEEDRTEAVKEAEAAGEAVDAVLRRRRRRWPTTVLVLACLALGWGESRGIGPEPSQREVAVPVASATTERASGGLCGPREPVAGFVEELRAVSAASSDPALAELLRDAATVVAGLGTEREALCRGLAAADRLVRAEAMRRQAGEAELAATVAERDAFAAALKRIEAIDRPSGRWPLGVSLGVGLGADAGGDAVLLPLVVSFGWRF